MEENVACADVSEIRSLYPSNHRMTLIVLIASYWNNPRVPQGNFPDVLSRNPLLVIVVNCSFVRSYGRRTESRTKQQTWTTVHKRDLRRSRRIFRICLSRHSRCLVFCFPYLQALRHSLGLRWVTINETKAWHVKWIRFTVFPEYFRPPSIKRFIINVVFSNGT